MTPWDLFFREKVSKIFTDKKLIIDIGGGLRASKKSGNRYDQKRAWINALIAKADYKILDPVAKFNPDIVGDIHHLPLADNTIDSIICLAVLEHVNDPLKASREIYRVLKPGGYCLVFVPFLYYYHAEKNYYQDYWRFTKDSINDLFKAFSVLELQNVRGAIETWIHISPWGKIKIFAALAGFFDKVTKKSNSNQTSGYYVFLIK